MRVEAVSAVGALVAASVAQAPLSGLFLSFLVYSFGGWLWESTVCAMLNQGRFANSGFLLGPICPIYGVGALACWLLLRDIQNPVAMFFVAGLLCCSIEYLVGVALEYTCGARFWDYTDQPLNIQGRVCLYGFVLFGAASVFVCRVAEPCILGGLSLVPGVVLELVALAFAVVLGLDWMMTAASWRRLSTRLEELRAQLALRMNDSLGEASDRMLEALPDAAVEGLSEAVDRTREGASELVGRLDPRRHEGGVGEAARRMPRVGRRELAAWLSAAADTLVAGLGRRDLRFFNAFPQLRIPRYEGVISATHLKERVRDLFERM